MVPLGFHYISILFKSDKDVLDYLPNCVIRSLKSESILEVSAAINATANMANVPLAILCHDQILKLIEQQSTTPVIRRKAYIALQRCYSQDSSLVPKCLPETLAKILDSETHPGSLLSLTSLLETLLRLPSVDISPIQYRIVRTLVEPPESSGEFIWARIKLVTILKNIVKQGRFNSNENVADLDRIVAKICTTKPLNHKTGYNQQPYNLVSGVGRQYFY